MKKTLSLVLALILTASCCFYTSAATPDVVVPLWTNIRRITNTINFNGVDGVAIATVDAISTSADVTGTLGVYKQTDSGLEFIGRASGSSENGSLTLEVDFVGESGETYEAVFRVTVTENGVEESESKTAYKTCP